MNTIIVGAGIIGALTAYRLAQKGVQVTLIDAGQPAAASSAASFGWINASFYADIDHFRLRVASMQAHRDLAKDLGSTATRWQACLCWEEQGEAFDAQYKALKNLGYRIREVLKPEFETLEPAVRAPERALLFQDEGAVDLVQLTQDALTAATALGAQVISGVTVTGIETTSDRVSGVRWSGGVIPADRVVVAAGVATAGLMATVDVSVPMLQRPGLILRSQRLSPLLAHILVAPGQEIRQDPEGRILAPTSAAHQSDTTEIIQENPGALADATAKRIGSLLNQDIRWEGVALAPRPVPQDGLPVMGHVGPEGLYVATMHSGATLAPIAAQIAATEVAQQELNKVQSVLVAPYRPQRFTV